MSAVDEFYGIVEIINASKTQKINWLNSANVDIISVTLTDTIRENCRYFQDCYHFVLAWLLEDFTENRKAFTFGFSLINSVVKYPSCWKITEYFPQCKIDPSPLWLV